MTCRQLQDRVSMSVNTALMDCRTTRRIRPWSAQHACGVGFCAGHGRDGQHSMPHVVQDYMQDRAMVSTACMWCRIRCRTEARSAQHACGAGSGAGQAHGQHSMHVVQDQVQERGTASTACNVLQGHMQDRKRVNTACMRCRRGQDVRGSLQI
jgi:hypothetical protein